MAKKPKGRPDPDEPPPTTTTPPPSTKDEGSYPPTTTTPTKTPSSWLSWFSVSNIAIAIFIAYVGMVASNLHRIMNPVAYLPPSTSDTATLDPLWPETMLINVHCYIR